VSIAGFIQSWYHNKFNRILIISTLCIIFLIFGYFYSIPDYTIFPGNSSFQSITYSDKTIGGNSEILNFATTDTAILFDFILKDKSYVHYAGITLYQNNWKHIDVSHYNTITISMKSVGIHNIGVYFFTPNTYNSNIEDICFYNNFSIDSTKTLYSLSLNDFTIPNWWFDNAKLSPHESIPLDVSNIRYINISNAFTTQVNIVNSFVIYSVTFTRNNTQLLLLLIGIFLIVCIVSCVIHFLYIKTSVPQSIIVTYKSVETPEETNKSHKVFEFINSNYTDSELTLEHIAKHTGISSRKITSIIQETYQCNYKSYINTIRIEESKRLLSQTQLQIGEIADAVGFSSQSYFNVVFKNIVGESPLVYREKNSSRNIQ
jgi:AraC-like DNA-binding protein